VQHSQIHLLDRHHHPALISHERARFFLSDNERSTRTALESGGSIGPSG
jgi:hypothetical protein